MARHDYRTINVVILAILEEGSNTVSTMHSVNWWSILRSQADWYNNSIRRTIGDKIDGEDPAWVKLKGNTLE